MVLNEAYGISRFDKYRWYWYLALVALILATMILGLGGDSSPAVPSTESLRSWIVQGQSTDQVIELVEAEEGLITSELTLINGAGAMLTEEAAEKLSGLEGVTVTPNHGVVGIQSVGDEEDPEGEVNDIHDTADYSELVGANQVWDQGITGDGVTVAILDTGVYKFKGIKKDTENKKRIVEWKDIIRELNLTEKYGEIPANAKFRTKDPNGHGTHIAGIIANSQEGKDDGAWMGVAPDVNLLPVRVLDRKGQGSYESVILGIQYVVENQDEFNVRVMNLSLVSDVQSPYWADPLNQAVSSAWNSGIVVVAAAGNIGPDPLTIAVPGNNPYVITVGAFTDNFTPDDWSDDYITPFSSAGPTHDAFVKPDIMAPGAHMVSLMRHKTYLAKKYPDNIVDKNYATLAGTSQATAVTSGVVALMLEANPELTPNEVKYRLQESALLWLDEETQFPNYSIWQQGAGRVNGYDAVFGDIQGEANVGLDINDPENHLGWTYYDPDLEMFMIYDIEDSGYGSWAGNYFTWNGGYGSWAGGYGSWAGGYGSWAGGYGSWAGSFDSWAGGYGSWAGGYGSWAGGYGSWAGGYGSWAGGYGSWAGGYGSWAGGYGSWAGSTDPFASGYGSWAGSFSDSDFLAANTPDSASSSATIGTITDVSD